MAFTVRDFADLRRLLGTHPEWRVELRQLVLTDELLILPAIVRDLAQAQVRTEARLEALTARVEELAQAQVRTEQRVAELAQAQARTEAHLEALTARVDALAARVEELVEAQKRVDLRLEDLTQKIGILTEEMKWAKDRLGQLLGWRLEARYREKPGSFFGRWFKPAVPLAFESLREKLEPHLTEDEIEEIMSLDLLVQGRARTLPNNPEVVLALEISGAIDPEGVERVKRRTELLRKAGYHAVPVVAGEGVIPSATPRLEGMPIVLMLDGRSQGWEQALAAAASSVGESNSSCNAPGGAGDL